MSDTIKEQNDSKGLPAVRQSPVQWPSQPIDKDIHINCGTPECCVECKPKEDKQ